MDDMEDPPGVEAPRCPVCGGTTETFLPITVRGSIETEYRRCFICSFLFIPRPSWLEESFGSTLQKEDVGALDRNIVVADFLRPVVRWLVPPDAQCVDWGGGYGLLSRLMRDRGYDFRSFDRHTAPLFHSPAPDPPGGPFDLVTLVEVALHFVDPPCEFAEICALSDVVFFTAVVSPAEPPADWWYFMARTGQHVAIYSIDSLKALAEHLDVRLTTDGKFFHVFHRRPLPVRVRLLFRSRLLAYGISLSMDVVSKLARLVGRRGSIDDANDVD